MFRRLVVATLGAVALAAVLLVPSLSEAAGPAWVFCVYPNGHPETGEPYRDIHIGPDEEAHTMREAVAICRYEGGHPNGAVHG